MNLQDIQCCYFIGIGGIGMSAIARYFNSIGIAVHGYDKTETALTKKLVEEGIDIHYADDVQQIPEQVDLVVFTPAVPDSLQELQYLRSTKIPIKKRAEVLGIISRNRKTIAIAGTHGKTTTTTITTHLLRSGGVDCSAFLGGIAQNFGSNFVAGNSEWVVVEADEYDRSFLQLSPNIAGILSMDADHLDIYGDRESIVETGFRAFAQRLKPGGELWVRNGLGHHFDVARTFGLDAGQARSENIRVQNGYFTFDYVSTDVKMQNLQFALPGRHNVENATLAITIALSLGVKEADIREALMTFKGIKRRFDMIVRGNDNVYIDDYAHHPTELKAAIAAARQLYPDRELCGIFQPHLYSRTRDFVDGFAAALDGLDIPILMNIYPAREEPIPGVSTQMILDRMQNQRKQWLSRAEILTYVTNNPVEVLMTLGAGDIDRLIEPLSDLMQ
ncbi:MAG: UDP-N-acetylmuramate--L-alanine ligase [Saprospiraceae bacterium]|nr:UDP-N-acetylmuramate--L-alanine ligase [Saprospiraceae bacterium]